jgi:hypothetical protein
MKKASKTCILKALLFITLFSVFFFLFFWQVVVQYLEKYTNLAKIAERVNTVEAPTLAICSGWKTYLMEKYKITPLVFMKRPTGENNIPKNLTVRKLYDEVTHELNRDFSISVSNILSHPISLNIGVNIIKEGEHVQKYLVKENLSTHNGKCYVIIPNQLEMKPMSDTWSVAIARNITSENKDMDKVFIQISSNDTINTLNFKISGVTNEVTEHTFTEEKTGYLGIDYTEKNMEFIKDCSEVTFFRCFAKKINETSKFNCSKKCIPIYAQSVMENINHDIPQCSNNDEEYCMIGLENYKKYMELKSECLKQCKNKVAILDMERILSKPVFHIGDVQLDMYFHMAPERLSYKEYLIYDGITMFGSIGGSLGLFVGFSLFDSLSLVLDYCLKKMKCK